MRRRVTVTGNSLLPVTVAVKQVGLALKAASPW
jgi:hypothetical protein